MHTTYAPTAILFGIIIGFVVAVQVNVVLGVLAGLGISVGGWIAIQAIEKALYRTLQSGMDAVTRKISEKSQKK